MPIGLLCQQVLAYRRFWQQGGGFAPIIRECDMNVGIIRSSVKLGLTKIWGSVPPVVVPPPLEPPIPVSRRVFAAAACPVPWINTSRLMLYGRRGL